MSQKKAWIWKGLQYVLGCGLLLSSTPGYSTEVVSLGQHPLIPNAVLMKDAVQVQISPRGQKLFSTQLMQLLTNLGVVVNENYFPPFNYVSEEPIKIDELAKKQPEQFDMLIKVRQFFKQYLQGIEFKDFRPSIQLGNSDYTADLSRLSLVTDEELMKSLGKKDGAVLAIEMSIRKLHAHTDNIQIKDLENPWMGEIGIQNPEITFGTPDNPLIARMPFYVRVDENGLLSFQALQVSENIDRVPIELKYQKIILPQFEFKVSGQNQVYKIKLNEDEFKKIVDDHLPEGLKMIRQSLRGFLQNELPKILNDKAQESLKNDLEQIQPISAPGTQAGDTRPPLSLGLKLTKLNLKNSNWSIGLSAFIEDTSILPRITPFWPGSGARGTPTFNHLAGDQYDLAIAVDRALFNRAIHLASNRQNFKKMETCPGQPPIELLSGPAIDFNAKVKPQSDLEAPIVMFIDARADVPEADRTRLGLPVLPDKLHIKLRYQALIKPSHPGSTQLSIYPIGPDLDSLWIDTSSLPFLGKVFQGKIITALKERLSAPSSCGKGEPMANFQLINSLWGIPLEYTKIRMDPQGQLMMYMSYKNVNPGQENGQRK